MNSILGVGVSVRLVICLAVLVATTQATICAAVHPVDPNGLVASRTIPAIELRTATPAQRLDDNFKVTQTEYGAQLHCESQHLTGEATPEGLWLTSTNGNTRVARFRVLAAQIGCTAAATRLSQTGNVTVVGETVRFIRPGLVEEYTVSKDGVRQDFIVLEKPVSNSHSQTELERSHSDDLQVELAVTGATVEQTPLGVELVLKQSGRKIAYSRLRAFDANGDELQARFELKNTSRQEVQSPAPQEILLAVIDASHAVYPIRIDPTFSDANWLSLGGIPGVDSSVYASVVDTNGNLYVGGAFTIAGNVSASCIAKWDGNNWSALGSGIGGPNAYVASLAVSGTNLFVGGRFTTAGGGQCYQHCKMGWQFLVQSWRGDERNCQGLGSIRG